MQMIKQKLSKIMHNRLVKSVLVVASGTAGAQAIGMLFVPFITRTYGPEVYGVLGAFVALTAVLTILAALCYPIAIVLPPQDNEAKALVKLSLCIALVVSAAVALLLLLAGDWIITQLGVAALIDFKFLIPLVMLFSACQEVSQQWLIRKKHFKGIANIAVAHAVVNYGSQALAGLFAPIAALLIGIHSAAIALRASLTSHLGRKLERTKARQSDPPPVPVSLRQVAVAYKDFPLYRAPQVVLNTASKSLPILMLGAFFGPAVVGYYVLTRSVLGLPATLLGASVQSVFYPHFNEAVVGQRQTLPLLLKATLGLAVIGVWPFLIIILFGPDLFAWVFGAAWQTAGQYAQWLAVWSFFALANRPSVSAIPVFRLQAWFLNYEWVSLVLRVVALYMGFFYFADALIAVALFSVVGALLNLYLVGKTLTVAQVFDREQTHE